jgi:FtsP/CotA-like multicopper oxidase with cupredoxin domain
MARRRLPRALRIALPLVAAAAVLVPIALFWAASLLPPVLDPMAMGPPDFGGGTPLAMPHGSMPHLAMPGQRSVTTFAPDPARPADVRVDLVARSARFEVGGAVVDGYTLNGRSPGPQITAKQGDLVEVHLHNASVPGGTTLHWHGVDVPGAMDGVAGVTQDEVALGQDYTYRFVVPSAGSFWYHSHQVADAEVVGGLFGALVVLPRTPLDVARDVAVLSHTYAGVRTLNGRAADLRVTAPPGALVRLRLVDTDNGPIQAWADVPYRVAAVDGTDVHGPTDVRNRSVTVTSGGRIDLGVRVPDDGRAARVQVSGARAVLVGSSPAKDPGPVAAPREELDLLSYGTSAPLGFDPGRADRRFVYDIGRTFGFLGGLPGLQWTVNGHLYPHVPMFRVQEGDIVRMHIVNGSGDVHPMHLHGHHAVVLARNGVRATGSPWWVDSLNVRNGESYDIAFVADNPGIWMDHCHNLQHAADGMIVHLMYSGVTTPFVIGGPEHNHPE